MSVPGSGHDVNDTLLEHRVDAEVNNLHDIAPEKKPGFFQLVMDKFKKLPDNEKHKLI